MQLAVTHSTYAMRSTVGTNRNNPCGINVKQHQTIELAFRLNRTYFAAQ